VILDLASHIGGSEEPSASLGAGVLPDQASFDVSLSSIASFRPDPSLAVTDPLVPLGSPSGKPRQVFSYDRHGLSAYARATLALHHAVSRNRHASLQNLWALRHLSALAVFARDFAAIPSLPNPLFAPQDLPEAQVRAEEIVEKTHQSILYMLTAVSDELSSSWHQDMIASLREVGSRALINGGQLAELVGVLYSKSVQEEGSLFPRILHIVLRGILREASSEEANLWLGLAQTIQDRGEMFSLPHLRYSLTHLAAVHSAMAILLCLINLNLEFPRLDRYRNEIASRLSGVSPQKAKTEGLKLLRLLDAAAPNAESGVIFLPTQRTVFMVQTCQKWVNGDDDLSEEIESQLVSVFIHIAPLLQSIPGSHWDFIADLVELNLEVGMNSVSLLFIIVLIDVRRLRMLHSKTSRSLRSIEHCGWSWKLTSLRHPIEHYEKFGVGDNQQYID
jgi:E3 ubiquitin-protein ligase listerin